MRKLSTMGLRALVASTAVIVLSAVLTAGAASAASTAREYGELLTSDGVFVLPKDVRARVDLASAVDPLDAVTQGTVDAGMGLGNGYVAHRSYVQYTHTFAPTESVDSIVSASLSIAIWDDQLFEFEPETVTISLDGELWKKNQATWAYLHDSVSAHLFEEDGEFKVTVFATQGDTQIGWSFFSATYLTPDVSTSGGGVSPMPEPGGVALFYSGLLVFGTVRSRMRSGPRS